MDDASYARRAPASRYAVFVMIAALGLVADLATKAWVFDWPGKLTGRVWWVWEPYAGFQTTLNEGALFGMGQGAVFWFAAVSVAAAIALPVWLFASGAAREWGLVIPLGGILGGILGNLYDRLGMHGETWPPGAPRAGEAVYAVRDWILLQANDQWRWPNFNLADSLLVVGAAWLLLRAATESSPDNSTGDATAASSPDRSD